MFTGTVIEELLELVERVEARAHDPREYRSVSLPPSFEVLPPRTRERFSYNDLFAGVA